MDLHELIQSMSKAEKRHFKLYVQSGLGKGQLPKYLSLFDLLNRQEYYDEKKVTRKGFNYDDKSILNEKILEALHVFHAGKSIDSELTILLHQISILYQKSLWNELSKRAKKARKLATEHERFLSLLEVIRWDRIITHRQGNYEAYNLLIKEQMKIREILDEEMHYVELADRIGIILLRDGALNKAENRLQIEKWANELSSKKYPESALAQIAYHRVRFRYYFHIKKDKKQAYAEVFKIVQLYDIHDFVLLKEGHIALYLIMLYWQRTLSDNPNQKIDFVKIIEQLPQQSPHTVYAAYTFGLADCQRNLNEESGELIIKKMEDEQYFSKIKLPKKLPLFYNIIIFYSSFGKWEKAQRWLDEILSIKRPTVRRDIQIKLRFWLLVVAYERVPDELDKHIQSMQKYLKRANHNSDIQQQVIQAFNDLDQAIGHAKKKVIWEKLHITLEKEAQHSVSTDIPIRELQRWCKSKIERITIAEVMEKHSI